MPFGLKNAVTKMFKDKLGDTMEVYIDDMVMKSIHPISRSILTHFKYNPG